MIEALTFDFWNTLFKMPSEKDRPYQRLHYLHELLGSLGWNRSPEEIMQAIRETWDRAYRLQRQEGYDIGPSGQVEHLIETLHLELDSEQSKVVYDLYTGYLKKHPPQINDGVAEVIPVLASRYRMAVICNTGATPGSTLLQMMEDKGIARYFKHHVFSDQVHWAKPNPLIFQYTLGLLGAAPGMAAHIGDDPSTDVKGAHASGMLAVWLAPEATEPVPDCDYHIRSLNELLTIF